MSLAPAEMVEIVVNGERRSVRRGRTILALLASLGLDPARVAIELDREILKKDRWASTCLNGGERVEDRESGG